MPTIERRTMEMESNPIPTRIRKNILISLREKCVITTIEKMKLLRYKQKSLM
jgi:hypothetical protein